MKREPTLTLLALLLCIGALQAREIKLGVKSGELKYDKTRLVVKPGEQISLVFANNDQMPHNLVICRIKTDIKTVADAAVKLGAEGLKLDYLPKLDSILWATKLVQQGQSETLTFKAPKKPGDYPFVCTFPGHYVMMNGILQVGGKPSDSPLSALSYKYYEGEWQKLPDFSKLEPKKVGVLPKNLINVNLKGFKKDKYAVVFSGKLKVPKTGSYHITAGSDDGGRILINGKRAWEHDGIHPAKPSREKVELTEGLHDVEIQYFELGGQNVFSIEWKVPGNKKTVSWSVDASQGTPTGEPILLEPTDKPVLYRDFFSTAGSRGIGVGYPEKVNALFDANYCRWMQLWRGDFLNARVHWVGRGQGTTKPEGDDVLDLFHADPIAFLKSPDETWPTRVEHKGDIPGEKSGVQFGGYLLDTKGRPTLLYSLNGAEVTDRLDPVNIDGNMCFKRTVEISGALDGLSVFGGRARQITNEAGTSYKIGDELMVTFTLNGFDKPEIRANDAGFDLVLPIKAGQTSASIEEVIQW